MTQIPEGTAEGIVGTAGLLWIIKELIALLRRGAQKDKGDTAQGALLVAITKLQGEIQHWTEAVQKLGQELAAMRSAQAQATELLARLEQRLLAAEREIDRLREGGGLCG